MKNCVIKKLADSINDTTLPTFKFLNTSWKAKNNIGFNSATAGTENLFVSVEITSNDGKLNNAKSWDESMIANGMNLTGTAPITMQFNKERTEIVFGTGYSLSNLEDAAQLKDIESEYYNGSESSKVVGDISSLSELVNLEVININLNTDITGDLLSFAKLINLKYLNPGSAGNHVHGIVEKLIAAQVANGRTSGIIKWAGSSGNNVRFNGNTFGYSAGRNFTWVPNSSDNTKTDITCDGTTITVDADGNIIS